MRIISRDQLWSQFTPLVYRLTRDVPLQSGIKPTLTANSALPSLDAPQDLEQADYQQVVTARAGLARLAAYGSNTVAFHAL